MKYAIDHSRRLCRRAASVARRQDAAPGGHHAGHGRDRAPRASSAGPTMCPPSLPAGSDVANLSLLGYDPLAHFTGRAPLEAAAQGIAAGPERLGHPLQPGDGRRPGDARLHGRAHLDRRSPRTAGHGAGAARQRRAASSIPGVSYRNLLIYRGAKRAAAVHRRHASHAAARSDRQVGARRLSARAGQRPAEPIDERQRGAVRRSSGQRQAPRRTANCRPRTSGCGAKGARRRCRRLRKSTASAGR